MSNSQWVDERLTALDPNADWQPSVSRALGRFRQHADARPKRRWSRGLAMAAATLILFLGLMGSLHAPRVFAQRCLEYCSEVLSLDRSQAVPPTGVSTPTSPEEAGVVLPGLDGLDVTLEQYKGKVVLVNFWASWCAPCLTEIPSLIEFSKKYNAQGLVIVGVAMDADGSESVAPWVRNQVFQVDGRPQTMNYKIVLGNQAIADKFGGVLGLPTSFLYARDGKRIKTILGLLNPDDVRKEIESQLKTDTE